MQRWSGRRDSNPIYVGGVLSQGLIGRRCPTRDRRMSGHGRAPCPHFAYIVTDRKSVV